MPLSPSINVIELRHDAVFMNAGVVGHERMHDYDQELLEKLAVMEREECRGQQAPKVNNPKKAKAIRARGEEPMHDYDQELLEKLAVMEREECRGQQAPKVNN